MSFLVFFYYFSQAYKEVKKEKPPFLPQEEPVAEPEAQIPEELLCRVCKDLLQDAVLIHCCGNSFCDECKKLFQFYFGIDIYVLKR